jgi:hypothetical protein
MMPESRFVLISTNFEAKANSFIQPKMVYASSKDALKRALNGIATEFQANDVDDIEYQSVLAKVSKGLA